MTSLNEALNSIENNLNANTTIDFSHDSMDFERFPLVIWKKFTQKILQPSDDDLFSYGDRKGEPYLRGLITEYLRQNRGVSCHPSQVVITSGTQQAILILCSLLNKDLRRIAVESAMHPGIYRIFMQQQMDPVPISLHNGTALTVKNFLNRRACKVCTLNPLSSIPLWDDYVGFQTG